MSNESDNFGLDTEQTDVSTIICPHCFETVDHVNRHGRSWAKQCPKCGKALKKDLIPEGFTVVQKEAKSKPAARTPPTGDLPPDSVGPPFKRAKAPHELLKEVCEYHGLKEEFVNYVYRKAEAKQGGMHPTEFNQILQDLDSGVKTRKQIAYIVGDYLELLTSEKQKAQEAGVQMIYPAGLMDEADLGSVTGYGGGMPGGSRGSYGASYPSQQMQGIRGPPGGAITREEVFRTMQDFGKQLLADKKKEDEMSMLREQVRKIPEMLAKAVAEGDSGDGVSHDEFLAGLKDISESIAKKDQNSYIKYLEKKSGDDSDMAKDLVTRYEKVIENLTDKLDNRDPISTDSYQRDETRLLAEAIHAASKKSPMKEFASLVLAASRPTEQTVKREQVAGGSSVAELLPSEYLE